MSIHQMIPGTTPGQRVRDITLRVQTLDGGGYRVSSPQARGWAAVAKTPVDLARAIHQAYLEVSCASYARFKGRPYDLDLLTTHVDGDPLAEGPQARQRARRSTTKAAHHPASWARLTDTTWRSPSGRVYRQDTRAVTAVIRRRRELGLPT